MNLLMKLPIKLGYKSFSGFNLRIFLDFILKNSCIGKNVPTRIMLLVNTFEIPEKNVYLNPSFLRIW